MTTSTTTIAGGTALPAVIDARHIPSANEPWEATELHPATSPCGMPWMYEGLNAGGHQVFRCPKGDHKLITSRVSDRHAGCTPQCEEPFGVIRASDYGPEEA